MTLLEDRLTQAVRDLRNELDAVDPPPFKPNRSAAPLVFVLVLLLGIGAVGYVVGSRPDDSGGISIATQPEAPDSAADGLAEDPSASDPDLAVPDASEAAPDGPAPGAISATFDQQLTTASAGEFYVPIPGAPAWSRDESRVLVYRTGAARGGHLVVNVADPETDAIELPFVPPDIEQIYWHPLRDDQLLYAEGNALMAFDLSDRESTVVRTFEECESVDSGLSPVPPARDGTVSMLCKRGSTPTQVAFDLTSSLERRVATASDTAAVPSPSGDRFVRWNPDGSAAVLDRNLNETGVVLDLDSNRFDFIADATGEEWVVASLFDGPAVGTIVALPLDGGDAVVIVGPDRGDPYPPGGNLISASGTRIAVSTRGPADGPLAGNITVVDVAESFAAPERFAIPHNSEAQFEFWSNPFLSLSPSGQAVVYSSDKGSGAVDVFVTAVASFPE